MDSKHISGPTHKSILCKPISTHIYPITVLFLHQTSLSLPPPPPSTVAPHPYVSLSLPPTTTTNNHHHYTASPLQRVSVTFFCEVYNYDQSDAGKTSSKVVGYPIQTSNITWNQFDDILCLIYNYGYKEPSAIAYQFGTGKNSGQIVDAYRTSGQNRKMEQRLANTWKMTVNEKKFIETALVADIRVDGRRPFDYRRLAIKFGREDGSSEVQLGQTHVMGFVTSELVQPYRDRQNEGTLSIFTELSPMADPSFEAGRAGESAVELARIIDRGLRDSRAVDMESLCVIAGKLVWAIRVDLHILDNGGNLVDAANIAALVALSTFRRPEFTLGGEDGQEVIIHPPEVREPLPLVIHHFPIAVTFGFFGDDNIVVIDPTHKEESVMGGRMIATLNTNGDICAIQKAGRVGVMQTIIMQCLRIASVKAGDITSKIKNAVESYNTERALRKIKRHSCAASDVHKPVDWETQNQSVDQQRMSDLPGHRERLKPMSKESGVSQSNNMEGVLTPSKPPEELTDEKPFETESDRPNADIMPAHSPDGALGTGGQTNRKNTLEDAVKPKHKRKKKKSSNIDAS